MNYIGVGVEAVASELGILGESEVEEGLLIKGLQFRFEGTLSEIKKAIRQAEEGNAIRRNGTKIKLNGPVA